MVDIGDGPAVVFLHGLSGCWQNWLESIPPLAADHRVIAIDLPGFGESPMPAEPISVSGYARIVVELLDALGVERATIVGNSMGGFVGCEMAIRFPARVERLVLVAAAGLSLRHMRHERKRGLRARAENLLFFGLGRLAGRTDLVVRSRRLRRGLLLLVAAHPERLPGPLILEQAHGAGKPGFDDALEAMTAYPIRDRLGEIALPGAHRLGRGGPPRAGARRRRVRVADPRRAQGPLPRHGAHGDARAPGALQRRRARVHPVVSAIGSPTATRPGSSTSP